MFKNLEGFLKEEAIEVVVLRALPEMIAEILAAPFAVALVPQRGVDTHFRTLSFSYPFAVGNGRLSFDAETTVKFGVRNGRFGIRNGRFRIGN